MSHSAVASRAEQQVWRLGQAINDHDLEAIVACFTPDVASEQPAHPSRNFHGIEQLRRNWTQILGSVAGLRAEQLGRVSEGSTVWVEWRWSGWRADGQPFAMNGVTIQHVTDLGIDSVRFFMEPLDTSGQRVGDAVRQATAS